MAAQFDSDFDEELFECADAGAANTFPTCAGDLRRGDLVCIRGRPVRIVESDTVKGGKHGHCKTSLSGEDIFTGKKMEIVAPSSYGLPCPVVHKSEYLLMDIHDDNSLSLLDDENEMRNDLDLPTAKDSSSSNGDALGRAIRAQFNAGKTVTVTTMKAMGEEHVCAFKVESANNGNNNKYESHGR